MKIQALLYKNLTKDIVQCTCCAHYCTLKNGEYWKCSIRKNENGKLMLLSYGRVFWLNIDPIEKKPLFHFLPWEKVFSFWTAWCNFTCTFCQNWTSSQFKVNNKEYYNQISSDYEEALNQVWQELSPEMIVKFCKKNDIRIIAYTYNEPTIFFEYLRDVSLLAKKEWILTVMVSNGFQSKEFWDEAKNFIDAINIDLKWWSDDFYTKICGWRKEIVLENIKRVNSFENVFLEITTLIIPGENDSEKDLNEMALFIASINKNIPWHISAFHPDWKMLDKEITPLSTILKAYEIWKKHWLNYIYAWNVNLLKLEATYCPWCWKELIKRSGFVGENVEDLTNKTWICPNCNFQLAWVWEKEGKFLKEK